MSGHGDLGITTSRWLSAFLAAGLAMLSLWVTAASASEPIGAFKVTTSSTQAGGHPDFETQVSLDAPGQPEAAKSIAINLPEGVFGNPNAIPLCRSIDFAFEQCPSNSQAGLVTVRANYNGNPNTILGTAPLFDVQPQSDDETARFAFIVPTLNIPISIPVAVRTGSDYGLRMTVTGITQEAPPSFIDIALWGFPAATVNDSKRFGIGSPGAPAGCPGLFDTECLHEVSTGADIPVRPLTDNPTVCTGQPLKVSLDVVTYQDPAHPSHEEAAYPPTTGCEQETFNPVLALALTSSETDAPSGLDMQLRSRQFEGIATSPSEIRSAAVTLPQGLTINPDAADGQSACLDAQANFGNEAPAACPDNSKIGTFDIETPALSGPLRGSLYFGQPRPGDQYRVFMVADGFGVHAKLVAAVHPDPLTGQLTFRLDDLPQVPFDTFNLHLFASDRGLLATPNYCTLYRGEAFFTPWNDVLAPQSSTPIVSLTSGPNGAPCPGQVRPFRPRLEAGTSTPIAGAYSDFTLKLDRDDGDQFLGDLNFTMPPGFTGKLRGIAYCPDGAIAAAAASLGRAEQAGPNCPPSAQIGTSNVAAGPGSHPFHAVGRMYLAGPFKGAPLSLVAITPALAGPYDYGTVVVRVALHVDPVTAQVTAVSDTVPAIIGGVPIRMRSIQVNIDRPEFTINPTNCSPFSVDSQGIGDQGTIADFSSYFHAVNCASLGFKPRMSIRQLGGPRTTHRSSNPRLQFDLRTRPGDANIKSLAVTLPKAFEIDQRHLANICSKSQLEKEHCAGRQAIGTATTTTPLLDAPLSGPAYAVSGYGNLPHVAFILGGQVTLIPQATTTTVRNGHLRTEVPVVPDAPIGHFRLTLFGGSRGYLVNTRDICEAPPVTKVTYAGQNGRTSSQRVVTKTSCGNSRASHRRHRG